MGRGLFEYVRLRMDVNRTPYNGTQNVWRGLPIHSQPGPPPEHWRRESPAGDLECRPRESNLALTGPKSEILTTEPKRHVIGSRGSAQAGLGWGGVSISPRALKTINAPGF